MDEASRSSKDEAARAVPVISAADMIAKLFGEGFAQRANEANKIAEAWRSTVSKIKDTGEQLSAHTAVADLKDGVLFVETDHPAWSQLLQLHSKFILKGLSFKLPKEGIKSLVFRIKRGD